MTRSFRSFLPVSAFVLAIASPLAAREAGPITGSDPIRITAAANVTLRTLPSAGAEAVAQLPLGTEVVNAGPAGLDKTWIRVKASDAREGWLLASLTKPLDPAWRWSTFDAIIADRLGRKGDGFPAFVELVAFIERVAPEYSDANGRAQLELSRLRALSSALAAIPKGASRRDPYASWLAARKADVVYDEPGGRWMLNGSMIWERHAKLAGATNTGVADEFAWIAVTTGLAGECEGQLTCYIEARNRLQGEYLRRHPAGKHATEAVDVVKSTADLLATPPAKGAAYAFDRKTDCKMLTTSLDALVAAVKATPAANRDATITSLNALRKACQ